MDIRLIDLNGKLIGDLDIIKATSLAKVRKCTLLKVAYNKKDSILIYKLINYNKYLFNKKKSIKKNKKNIIKEYFINFNIDDNDLIHLFTRIKISLIKGMIIYLYINNSRHLFKNNNKISFIKKISDLIISNLLINFLLKDSKKGIYFILKKNNE